MLELQSCSVSLTDGHIRHDVFSDVSFCCRPGETVAVLGPSGCGKTTLLNVCAGLRTPLSGAVRLGGQAVEKGNKKIAYVFQHFGLFPWFTVLENVGLGLYFRGVPPNKRREAAMSELARVGLAGLERRYPHQLSGGQQQRVALARSLVLKPEVLLLDEPFSALDSITREKLQELLATLLADQNLMTVLVTHSLEEAVFLGTSIVLMSPGPNSHAVEMRGLEKTVMRNAELRSQPDYYACCGKIRQSLAGSNS